MDGLPFVTKDAHHRSLNIRFQLNTVPIQNFPFNIFDHIWNIMLMVMGLVVHAFHTILHNIMDECVKI